MHTYQTTIKLHETDAAGVLFFSNQFKIVHDAYESLFDSIGFGLSKIIKDSDFFLPIVHAEADYKLPLFVGDALEVHTKVADIGISSFTLSYKLINLKKQCVGTAKTVHVSVNAQTHQKISLPDNLKKQLTSNTDK